MRRRNVSPELWTDERFVGLSPSAQLFVIGLLNVADKAGRLEDKPLSIKLKIQPASNTDPDALLGEIESAGLILRCPPAHRRSLDRGDTGCHECRSGLRVKSSTDDGGGGESRVGKGRTIRWTFSVKDPRGVVRYDGIFTRRLQHECHSGENHDMREFRHIRPPLAMLPAVFALLIPACGGGGGSGGNGVVSTGSFSAYLADSTISNADCVAIDATQNQLLITTGSGSGGHMSFTVSPAPAVNDWVLLECTGGSYRDPATDTTIVLSASTSLQQAYFKYTGDSPALVVMTLVSSVAALRVYGTGVPSDYPVQLRQVAILLGLGNNDISSVQPTDVTTTAPDASLAGQYGIVVAMLSEMVKDKPGTYNADMLTGALIASMLGGLVDSSTKADMQAALANYSASPQNTLVPPALLSASSPVALNLAAGNAVGALKTQSNTPLSRQAYVSGSALAYGMPVTATGGTPPYHYQFDTFANGTPPLGMSVNVLTGELNGKPTVPGPYTFGVCATDLVGASSCSQVSITIEPASASGGGGDGGMGGTIVGTWAVALSQGCTGSPAQYTFGASGSFSYLLPVQTCTSAGAPPSQNPVCNASGTYTTSGTNLSVNITQQDQACGGLTTPYNVSFSISGNTMNFGDGTVLTKQ